jgi:hypothetical protein
LGGLSATRGKQYLKWEKGYINFAFAIRLWLIGFAIFALPSASHTQNGQGFAITDLTKVKSKSLTINGIEYVKRVEPK